MFRKDETQQKNEEGMSLIEVLVSMVIVSVVLIGLGQGLVLGIRMNVESKARVANLSIAKRVTESLKSQTQFSQALFDGASDDSAFNRTFYVDSDGNDIVDAAETSPSAVGPTPDPQSNSSYSVM